MISSPQLMILISLIKKIESLHMIQSHNLPWEGLLKLALSVQIRTCYYPTKLLKLSSRVNGHYSLASKLQNNQQRHNNRQTYSKQIDCSNENKTHVNLTKYILMNNAINN